MWHAARRGVRAAASHAPVASPGRVIRGDVGAVATSVGGSWRAGAAGFAGRADRHHAFSSVSASALAGRRSVAHPGDFTTAPPLALRAVCELLHASSSVCGKEEDKNRKDGKGKDWTKDDKFKGANAFGKKTFNASKIVIPTAAVGAPAHDPPPGTPSILTDLLAGAKAIAVREDLDALASCVPDRNGGFGEVPATPLAHLTLTQFEHLLAEHGFATVTERTHVTRAFCDAGVVVRFEDLVYLNAAQVTKDILRTLPAVPAAVFGMAPATLLEVENELAAMKVEIDAAAARATLRSNFIVFAGLCMLCAQLATFMRLTYVELSWDVMEPVSYFVGVFNAILMYTYFMVNQRDFSFNDWSQRMQKHFWKRTIEGKQIDYEKYAKLMKRLRKRR